MTFELDQLILSPGSSVLIENVDWAVYEQLVEQLSECPATLSGAEQEGRPECDDARVSALGT